MSTSQDSVEFLDLTMRFGEQLEDLVLELDVNIEEVFFREEEKVHVRECLHCEEPLGFSEGSGCCEVYISEEAPSVDVCKGKIGFPSWLYIGSFSALDEVNPVEGVALEVDVLCLAYFERLEERGDGGNEFRGLPFEEVNAAQLVGVHDVSEFDF